MPQKALLSLFVCIVPAMLPAESPTFAFTVPPGQFAVGLRVVNQYDYSRTYLTVDPLGQPIQGEFARPIQTLIWYPATPSSQPHLKYGDYLDLGAEKDTFTPSPALVKSSAEEKAKFKEAASTSVWAIKDAAPAAGKFPVVIYAPSFSAFPFENADLCEFLASHGYLVLSSPSFGVDSINMTDDLNGIQAQVGDIEFLIAYARSLSQADTSHIAVAGFSWGGISNLFAAARDSRIGALVSLDGSARYFPKLVHDSGYVKPAQIAVPVLFFEQEVTPEQILKYKIDFSSSVLNDLKSSDLTLVHMHAMHHGDFASLDQRSPEYQAHREPTEYTVAEAAESYGWVCRYAVAFLDANFKADPAAEAFLKNSPAQNGVPNHLLGVERNPAQGKPTTFPAFRMELAKQGFNSAVDVYAKFKARDSEFKLTDGQIGDWGGQLVDDGHLPEAIEIFKLGISLYPDQSDLYDSLAEAYSKLGDVTSAIATYKKALEKNPSDTDAKEKLKELEAKSPNPK